MKHADAVTLIRKGISTNDVQRWAELGCGNGVFTLALASLLPPGSEIFGYDLRRQSLPASQNGVDIHFDQLDFDKEDLPVSKLNGVLMANSLHYVKDKANLITRLAVPKFLIVEYESRSANPWVPYPIMSEQLISLYNDLGYRADKLSSMPSRFGGRIYSLVAIKEH